ncbi:PTPRF interacting protein, binding protein 1 (liprin beta 1) S homeolog isoform X2 [Xenopus laevis]|uniref:PTPRF interacting protein, binding protein 1 (Liprin beta 1) S homeolog isoform X2 n=1 Tax=Xenopus laevis TaxID=8355 RepID=A0A8J0UMD3_XENLA|nr:PTPRF interacting protein, binding protein 1 (liprin beta 1) S homeolog isoform X2 [Xenopus laevis]
MMSDASEMLAAALEQMDGIIAGSKALEYTNGIFDCQSPTSPFLGSLRVLQLIEDLRGMLEMMETDERDGLRGQLPDSTADVLVEWLQSHMVNGHISGSTDICQERLARLENDKESFVLQVSVLTDQVEAQGEKIRDLEFCLEEHREKLNDTEEMLQQELLSRTSLESQKLDLMAEISNLKLKLVSVEKDRKEFEERYKDTESLHKVIADLRQQMEKVEVELALFQEKRSQYGDQEGLVQEMNELRLRVSEMENERSQYEKKMKSNKPLLAKLSSMKMKVGQIQYEKQRTEHKCQTLKDELSLLKEQLEHKEVDIKTLKESVERPPEVTDAVAGSERDVEVQKMKKAMESLMAANEEKEQKIEELRQSLSRYKKVQDMVVLAQGKKGKEVESDDSVISGSNSLVFDGNTLSDADKSPSPLPISATPSPEELPVDPQPKVEMHTSILQVSIPSFSSIRPFQRQNEAPAPAPKEEASPPDVGDGETPSLPADATTPEVPGSPVRKSSSLGSLKKEPAELRTVSPEPGKFETLPPRPPGQGAAPDDESFGSRKARSSFGRGFFKMKNTKKTSSTPNLDTEKGSTDHLDLAVSSPNSMEGGSPHSSSPNYKKKSRGIRKLFGKLKRSQSTTLNQEDELPEEEFKRGGTRSTAGPRLGWSRDLGQVNSELDTPFAKWTKDQVCTWLRDQGLGGYVSSCKQWIVSGQTLLHASQHDLEKELGIKQPLHRKKLQLALQSLGSEDESNYGRLDYRWVTRWLDDIGLPQYKTQFDDSKIDGRMLHYLAVEDLLSLKVVSVLHHLSIKRAIQVLRINSFEPNCLRRRPSDESNISPSEVAQWTNHRVMEWLRSVDLAEYAPNLRGSGVHGGLMVLEPRFNVETMAQLLNIPPNKTLLRRHLATHFNLLIGQQAQIQKQEALASPEYVLLTATAKVKPKKVAFSNFGTLRKKKQEEVEEYLCPMDLDQNSGDGIITPLRPSLDLRMLNDDDLDRLEQMEDSEGTVRQIGAFSEGINNLTHMLKEDDMFLDYSALSPSVTDDDSNV